MAMSDEKNILIKLTVEEIKTVLQVLDAFHKLSKITPAKGKKKEAIKQTNEALMGIMDKLQAKLSEEEKKEKKESKEEK